MPTPRRVWPRRAVTYRCRYCGLRLRFSGPNADHEALAAVAWHQHVCTVFPRLPRRGGR